MTVSAPTPSRRARLNEGTKPPTSVTIRASRPDDAASVANLARLDSARPPTGRLLVAEVDGVLRAGMSLDGGMTIADPFHHTADIVRLLEVRAQQIVSTPIRRRPTRGWLRFATPAAAEQGLS